MDHNDLLDDLEIVDLDDLDSFDFLSELDTGRQREIETTGPAENQDESEKREQVEASAMTVAGEWQDDPVQEQFQAENSDEPGTEKQYQTENAGDREAGEANRYQTENAGDREAGEANRYQAENAGDREAGEANRYQTGNAGDREVGDANRYQAENAGEKDIEQWETSAEQETHVGIGEESADDLEVLEIEDMDELEEAPVLDENDEERVAARKRRKKRQDLQVMMTCLVVVFAVCVLGLVIAVPGFFLSRRNNDSEQAKKEQQVQDILSSEGEIELVQEEDNTEVTDNTDVTQESAYQQKLDEIVDAAIEIMPLEDKVAGLFVVTPEALTGVSTAIRAGESTKDGLARYAVGGVVYFSKNIQDADQIKEMIANTDFYSKYPLFLAVDEEGGSVSRMADAGLADKSNSAAMIGQSGDSSRAYQTGSYIGTYLAEFGYNLDFAPVADINTAADSVMGSRSYGTSADAVIPFVTEMMRGLEDQGVTACVKHFPGLGSTSQDTHSGISMTERSKEEFYAEDFKVFQAAIDAGASMIMVGHISAPYLTVDTIPCSLSSVIVTDILRGELGFDGVVITDAMNMAAISDYYSSDEAAITALKAGCDMILMPEDFNMAYEGVLQAVKDGVISEERINDSLRRIYRIKYADRVTE